MKIGIVGDTHGSKKAFAIISKVFKDVQMLFHTGDHWQDAVYLEQIMGIPVITVKGNCDRAVRENELLLTVENKRFFLTHGHLYEVKYGLTSLQFRAEELGAEYCLFGHTHSPMILENNGIWFLNPGSLTWPRGKETYAGIIMEYKKNCFESSFMNIDRD
ncbi:MAG: metallophosphoesterase [Clostridia bacterium]|jgi:putative phosphoesterase|nr:metallophosphoesterase [Clostridia bacterium]